MNEGAIARSGDWQMAVEANQGGGAATAVPADEAIAAEDHDVVMVPRGYHPVTVPHGYTSYYLNVMAGEKRNWVFKNDPVHEWMLKPA